MLKISFDIKCGFERLYLVEKEAEFNLDFLYNNQESFAKKYPEKVYLNEQELYSCYVAKPDAIITDYNLFTVIRALISAEYFGACFRYFDQAKTKFFPELFVISCSII